MATNDIETFLPKSVIGFNGDVSGGLVSHPDGHHVIYPMGKKLVIQDWISGIQCILVGHVSDISSVAVSPCGKFLASGEILKRPYLKACVCIWDFENRSSLGKYEVHKSSVVGVTFSCDSSFVYSLGGLDDHCLAVWQIKTMTAISCKRIAKVLQSCDGMAIAAARTYPNYVITSSEEGIKVWEMELNKHQLSFDVVNVGKLRRNINCMVVDEDDTFVYGGTTTGDVMKVRLNFEQNPPKPVLVACLSKPPPIKKTRQPLEPLQTNGNYCSGVRSIVRIDSKHLAIGAGDGTIDVVEELSKNPKIKFQTGQKSPTISAFKVIKTFKLDSMITSVTRLGTKQLLVGTKCCDIYLTRLDNFKTFELHVTCHPSPVYSLALPKDTNEVFVTSGFEDLRIWRVMKKSNKIIEVHRIRNSGLECHNVLVAQDGSCIFSAWDDGAIRMYGPESGRLVSEIFGAHRQGVSALGVTSLSDRIISGGNEGQVRVWDCKQEAWSLTKVFAEQRGTISQVAIKDTDKEAATVCEDGTCYVWGIEPDEEVCGKQALQVGGKLSGVCFLPGPDPLLLTSGECRIVCWDTDQGVALREIETHASVTCLYVPTNGSASGRLFATGFEDGVVKVWDLLKGEATLVGQEGHGTKVNSIALSSDGNILFSASEDGSIFRWDCPSQLKPLVISTNRSTDRSTPVSTARSKESTSSATVGSIRSK